MLFRVSLIVMLFAAPCFAKDHKVRIKNVGANCILEAEANGDWAGVSPAVIELWQDPTGKFCVVPTDSAIGNEIVIECIMWDLKRRDRWFIFVGGDVPVPPAVVVPNKYGVGEVAYREVLKITDRRNAPTLIASLRTAASEMLVAKDPDQQDEVYDRHKNRMDAAMPAQWMPFRVATKNAIIQSILAEKIKTYTDQSAAINEIADAVELAK